MEHWYLKRQLLDDNTYEYDLTEMLGVKEKLIIGRKKEAVDILLPGFSPWNLVSRKHCVLEYVDNIWTVTDLRSTNGVWINNSLIEPETPTILEADDVLGIGSRKALYYATSCYVFDVLKKNKK